MLVPYAHAKNDEVFGEGNRADPARKGKGCCPGQTGHHLIPKAMIDQKHGGQCENYEHAKAPTVCVEGHTHSVGTHGLVHSKMDEAVNKMVGDEAVAYRWLENGQLSADRKTMGLDMTIEAAAQSHSAAFPFSGCSKNCIKAQLENHYKKSCKNKDGQAPRFGAVNKLGHEHKPVKNRNIAD